ncbi:MAG: hypothetical protein LC803_16605 [Acidobacteria bacterium]|nr:hypothetical protein [Acidobacteriota bacterium]
MSELSALDQAKLEALTGLIAAARGGGPSVQVVELAAADWPAPDGRVFYASTFADDIFPGLRAHLGDAVVEPRLDGGQFLDVTRDSGISDDSVSLNLWDADHAISDLFETHGEGVRIELFHYYPQVDLLLSMWFGHLRPPEDADEERFTAHAENGFLSVMLPLPRRAFFNTCQAVFGALLSTQEEIDEHDCPYNRHLPGGATGNLDPDTGLPFTSCPRNTRAACIARLDDDLSYLAFDTKAVTYSVGSKGATATTRGNENNLKRPLRVIAGERTVRDLDLLAYIVEVGRADHPERGAIKLQYAVSEGILNNLNQPKVNNTLIQPAHWGVRLGWPRQPGTGFTPGANNYSGTAILQVVLQGDFRNVDPAGISTEIKARGKSDVRVYTAETTFTPVYTRSRAWWLLEALRNKRWGYGAAVSRFALESDFIPLDEWFAEPVGMRDKDNNIIAGPRTLFDAELIDRTAQQQINDICLAGRCTVPFPFQGKLRVFPLKKATEEELAEALVFSDYGDARNIIRDEVTGKSSLTRTVISDRDLPNSIKVIFDNAEQEHAEHPLVFDSIDQQLRAGRAFSDTGRRVVEKDYRLLGVTRIGEANRLGVLLRDLGEFDEGGLENNLRVRFQSFFTQTLTLYKSKIIRVLSKSLVNRRTGVQKFEYFRVRSVRQLPNLLVEVSAQAYPVEYYERLEDLEAPPEGGGGSDLLPGIGRRPRAIEFKEIDFTNDRIILDFGRPTV